MKSVITIALSLVAISVWSQNYLDAYIDKGNIIVHDFYGNKLQLTYSGADTLPFVIQGNNEVLFVRNIPESEYIRKQIMKVDMTSLRETVLLDKKPMKDKNGSSQDLVFIGDPALSQDKRYLYFLSDEYATSSALVRFEITTKRWVTLFAADYFQIVQAGLFKGEYAIGRSEIRDRGRDTYYMIVDESGNTLKEFSNLDVMQSFLSNSY